MKENMKTSIKRRTPQTGTIEVWLDKKTLDRDYSAYCDKSVRYCNEKSKINSPHRKQGSKDTVGKT